MGRIAKIWLVIAVFFVLIGCIVFGGAMAMLKWDFTKLQTTKYETNSYDINEQFKDLSIVTDTADIIVVPSADGEHSVVCYEQKNAKHTVAVQDNTLVIEVLDTRKWYEYIGIHFGAPKITVSIPQGEYGSLSIKSSTGHIEIPNEFRYERMEISENTGKVTVSASVSDTVKIKTNTGEICVENASAGALDLSTSTGRITVSNVVCEGDANINVSTGKANLTGITCKNLVSSGNTGDISLKNVLATEKLSIKRDTGDVRFDNSDAADIFVETDTGDVTGTLLSEKVFLAQTDTGHIDIPKTANGGMCEITTDTGNIKISVR